MKRVLLGLVQPAGAEAMKVGTFLYGLIKNAAPGQGFDLGEVRARLNIMDKIEASVDEAYIDLEDAEHALVQRALNEGRYVEASHALIEIADRILGAVSPTKPK